MNANGVLSAQQTSTTGLERQHGVRGPPRWRKRSRLQSTTRSPVQEPGSPGCPVAPLRKLPTTTAEVDTAARSLHETDGSTAALTTPINRDAATCRPNTDAKGAHAADFFA